MMELHVDDTAGDEREDMLTEMAFHIPASNPDFVGDLESSASKVLLDQVGGWAGGQGWFVCVCCGGGAEDQAVCVGGGRGTKVWGAGWRGAGH